VTAAMNHNTFLLALHATIEAILFSFQFSIASQIMVLSAPEYPVAVRENCLQNVPETSGAGDDGVDTECAGYLASDRYSGFHLVWMYNYQQAMGDSDTYKEFDTFQKNGDCCGFGPPLKCEEDTSKFPQDRLLTGTESEWVAQRRICGSEDLYYPTSGKSSYVCSQYVDATAASPVVGGCRYDMPLGNCKDYWPEDGTKGCASVLEFSMNTTLFVQGTVVLIFTTFQLLSVLAACCRCWKKKDTDVLPELEFSAAGGGRFDPYAPIGQRGNKQKKLRSLRGTAVEPIMVAVGSEEKREMFCPEPKEETKEGPGKLLVGTI